MRKVILTEEQYINFILNEYSKNGLLLEGKINAELIKKCILNGCKSIKDCAKRINIFSKRMGISSAVVITIIVAICSMSNNEKEQLEREVQTEQVQETTPQISEHERAMLDLDYVSSFGLSEEGANHIKSFEKLRLKPYYATEKEKAKGIRTIGYGHVIKPTDPQWLKQASEITQEQADELFNQDMEVFVNEFIKCTKSLPAKLQDPSLYTQGFVDAAISLLFNSGMGNFKKSNFFTTWKKCRINNETNKIMRDDYVFTATRLKNSMVKQGGKELNGLKTRRDAESDMACPF